MKSNLRLADNKRNVYITGISGYIGRKLLENLSNLPEIGKITGTDIRPLSSSCTKLSFYRRGILEPPDDILNDNQIDTVIHLAFVVKPTHQKMMAGQVDIEGTRVLLEACRKTRVKFILYLSSHTVYGAYADNPSLITEEHPVHPLVGFQYAEDKVKVEKLLQDYGRENPGTGITILRVCPVIGRGAGGTISTVMMQQPVMLSLRGYDPPMQFVHEDDLVQLMQQMIVRPVPGIFNVAGEGTIKYSEIAGMTGKRRLVLPEGLVRPLLSLSWRLHLQNRSPPVGLEFIKYPPLVST